MSVLAPVRGAALLLLLACAAVGCDVDLGPTWVEIGEGLEQHADLTDGDEVAIVEGPQGGYMIALSLGAGGVVAGDPADPTDPKNPRVTFQAFREDDSDRADPLGSITVVRGLDRTDDGDLELVGTWLVFDAALETSVYFDQVIVTDVRLVDTRGNEATDSATVTATWSGETAETGRAAR